MHPPEADRTKAFTAVFECSSGPEADAADECAAFGIRDEPSRLFQERHTSVGHNDGVADFE